MRTRLVPAAITGFAAGLIVLLGSGQAMADTVAQDSHTVKSQTGLRASVSATTTDAGALAIRAESTGFGGLLNLPILGGSSSADAGAIVDSTVVVEPGEYRLSVTVTDAQGSEESAGSNVVANVSSGFLGSIDPTPEGSTTVASEVGELTENERDFTLTSVVTFTETEQLYLAFNIFAQTRAQGNGARALVEAATSSVTFDVERIG